MTGKSGCDSFSKAVLPGRGFRKVPPFAVVSTSSGLHAVVFPFPCLKVCSQCDTSGLASPRSTGFRAGSICPPRSRIGGANRWTFCATLGQYGNFGSMLEGDESPKSTPPKQPLRFKKVTEVFALLEPPKLCFFACPEAPGLGSLEEMGRARSSVAFRGTVRLPFGFLLGLRFGSTTARPFREDIFNGSTDQLEVPGTPKLVVFCTQSELCQEFPDVKGLPYLRSSWICDKATGYLGLAHRSSSTRRCCQRMASACAAPAGAACQKGKGQRPSCWSCWCSEGNCPGFEHEPRFPQKETIGDGFSWGDQVGWIGCVFELVLGREWDTAPEHLQTTDSAPNHQTRGKLTLAWGEDRPLWLCGV